MKTMRSKPRRGMTMVASHFNGWYKGAVEKRAVGTRQHSNLVAYLRHARYPSPVYQPLKWLATIV
ncbi:MAG: hypothetical protein II949_14970 [Prevotella sp.]|nr:hypothetical protein [Prevotella sp.]